MTRLAHNFTALFHRAARWRSLDRRDRKVYLQAAALLAVVRAALWVLPFPALPRLIERWVRPAPGARPAAARDRLIRAHAVRAMARFVPFASCLTQSLTLFALLKALGDPAVLKIGVAKSEDGALLAHAWVETPDGACLTAGGRGDYQPLIKFENAPTLP